MNLIDQAAVMENPRKRFRILDAIPEHLRATAEFQAAENWKPPVDPGSAPSESNGKKKKVKDPKPPRQNGSSETQCCSSLGGGKNWCENLQIVFWMISYVAAAILMTLSTQMLLTDKALGFPSTLLMMGLSNGISFVLCQITVSIARCREKCLGSDPETK